MGISSGIWTTGISSFLSLVSIVPPPVVRYLAVVSFELSDLPLQILRFGLDSLILVVSFLERWFWFNLFFTPRWNGIFVGVTSYFRMFICYTCVPNFCIRKRWIINLNANERPVLYFVVNTYTYLWELVNRVIRRKFSEISFWDLLFAGYL